MSSWLRTAVHKAVEVGQRKNLARIRNYADTVVQTAGQAVVGGAKLLQDRIGSRNIQNFRQNVKRLEELSVSCRGTERILLLRRWLISLKEIDRISRASYEKKQKSSDQDDKTDGNRQSSLVLYHDLDKGGEPLNFRDVFLHSQALEGIILSMILEAPNAEEAALLVEIFGLCLMGGKDVHTAMVKSVQELARVFSDYDDEILMKREELLHFAQGSISGLKITADQARIDVEVASLETKLCPKEGRLPPQGFGNRSSEAVGGPAEALKEALAQVRWYSKLKALLFEKKAIHNGDPLEAHAEKVYKMKVLLDSLHSSTTKAENRIAENRSRQEEALNFRLVKVSEVDQVEKELSVEIEALERQKEELEAELRRVNALLAASNARLHNAREERQQFDQASYEILQHLQMKEDELSRSAASCRKEADVVTTWIKFVENTCGLQSSCEKLKEDQVNHELVRYADYFMELILQLLPAYKSELAKSFTRFRHLVRKLNFCEGSDKAMLCLDYENNDEDLTSTRNRKHLEEEYLDLEVRLLTTFSVVESMKQIYIQNEDYSRKDYEKVKELVDALQKLKDEFEHLERPTLKPETPRLTSSKSMPHNFSSGSPRGSPTKLGPVSVQDVYSPGTVIDGNYFLESDEEQAALESEYVQLIRDHVAEDNDWEF